MAHRESYPVPTGLAPVDSLLVTHSLDVFPREDRLTEFALESDGKDEGEVDLRDQISQSHGKRRDRGSLQQIPIEGVDNVGVGWKPTLLTGHEEKRRGHSSLRNLDPFAEPPVGRLNQFEHPIVLVGQRKLREFFFSLVAGYGERAFRVEPADGLLVLQERFEVETAL